MQAGLLQDRPAPQRLKVCCSGAFSPFSLSGVMPQPPWGWPRSLPVELCARSQVLALAGVPSPGERRRQAPCPPQWCLPAEGWLFNLPHRAILVGSPCAPRPSSQLLGELSPASLLPRLKVGRAAAAQATEFWPLSPQLHHLLREKSVLSSDVPAPSSARGGGR